MTMRYHLLLLLWTIYLATSKRNWTQDVGRLKVGGTGSSASMDDGETDCCSARYSSTAARAYTQASRSIKSCGSFLTLMSRSEPYPCSERFSVTPLHYNNTLWRTEV